MSDEHFGLACKECRTDLTKGVFRHLVTVAVDVIESTFTQGHAEGEVIHPVDAGTFCSPRCAGIYLSRPA